MPTKSRPGTDMIFVHPAVARHPGRLAALQIRTGLLAVIERQRVRLVARNQ